MTLTGRCLCGSVRITVDGPHDPRPGACHCRMCQRWTGAVFASFAAEPGSVRIEGDVSQYASSEFAERAFCPKCGSHLWMRDTDRNDATFDLMPGLFDGLRNQPLQSEIYVDRAFACARLEGHHRRATRAEWEETHTFVEGNLE